MIFSEFVEKLVLIQGESAVKVSMTTVAYCVVIPIAGGTALAARHSMSRKNTISNNHLAVNNKW